MSGRVAIGLAMISPAPAKISAHAMAQYSARVTVPEVAGVVVSVMPAPR